MVDQPEKMRCWLVATSLRYMDGKFNLQTAFIMQMIHLKNIRLSLCSARLCMKRLLNTGRNSIAKPLEAEWKKDSNSQKHCRRSLLAPFKFAHIDYCLSLFGASTFAMPHVGCWLNATLHVVIVIVIVIVSFFLGNDVCLIVNICLMSAMMGYYINMQHTLEVTISLWRCCFYVAFKVI